jgi:hypothetical protein
MLPTILHRKAAALRKSTANNDFYTEHERQHVSVTEKIKTVLTRAVFILGTQHAFQVIAVLGAYNFGVMYILHSTLPLLFQTPSPGYAQSIEASGLNYISSKNHLVLQYSLIQTNSGVRTHLLSNFVTMLLQRPALKIMTTKHQSYF